MWFWIIVIAVVIGAIIGSLDSEGGAAEGAMAGGCLAAGCIGRIAMAALGILLVLWLFSVLFGNQIAAGPIKCRRRHLLVARHENSISFFCIAEIAVISGFCCLFVGCYAQRGMAGASEWCPSELAVGDYMK